MPLMREWTEITVDEDLLIPVVRELLDMAANPNQVEVVHGTNGRTILAEVHLAEHWFRERLKRDLQVPEDDSKVLTQIEVVVPANIPPVPAIVTKLVEPSKVAPITNLPAPPPLKRAPAPKPSASPNGEDA